jgi:phenylacetate-CoA ligase
MRCRARPAWLDWSAAGDDVTVTKQPGLAGLRARMESEYGSRLMAQLGRLGWDAGRLAAYQAGRLRVLLGRAVERSPFHARRLAHIDPGRFELADLARLPVMTKAQMMASFDEVVTDRRLTLSRVEDHLRATGPEPALLLGEYVCLVSGGSSGQRGVFVQTIGEYADYAAAALRNAVAGMLAAGPSSGGTVIAVAAAAAPVHSTGFLAAALGGGRVRMVPVPVTLPLAEAVERLNALQPDALAGYPARLAQLAAEQRAGRLRIAPRSVGTSSEMLTDANRAAITAAFGVPVVNSFASTEGLAGTSDPGGTVITFATDLCLAELVDAAGQPVPPGMPSAKVLITNLHNLTQPLIRYELADSLAATPGTQPGGYLRATVNGRDDGMLRYGDVSIDPHAIATILVSAAAVTEYQVRQTQAGIDVALVARDDLDQPALTAALAASLRQAGLSRPQVTVRVVAAIAHHPQTGKTRRFVPIGNDHDPHSEHR